MNVPELPSIDVRLDCIQPETVSIFLRGAFSVFINDPFQCLSAPASHLRGQRQLQQLSEDAGSLEAAAGPRFGCTSVQVIETVLLCDQDGLALDPNDVTGRFVLAWVLYCTSRLREAEQNALQALQFAPRFAGAQLLLAQIHLGQHNLPAAIDDMTTYLSFGAGSPLYAKVQEVRTQALRELSLQRKAIADAQAPDSGNHSDSN